MTTTTMNFANTGFRSAKTSKLPRVSDILAVFSSLHAEGPLAARPLDMASLAALAAIPFATLAWMFVSF
jgi:hypothetical protein